MKDFDLKKYLAENKLMKEGINPLKHHYLIKKLDPRDELINKLKDMDTNAYIATIEKLKDHQTLFYLYG